MSNYFLSLTILVTLAAAVFLLPHPVSAAQENLAELCRPIEEMDEISLARLCPGLSDKECQGVLEKCGRYYEEKIENYENEISTTQAKKKTLQNEITVLESKIKKINSQIYQSNLLIKDLNLQITETRSSIEETALKIGDLKKKLGSILQLRYEQDKINTIEIFLAQESLSDFFNDLMALESLNIKTQDLLADIGGLKVYLEEQEGEMEGEREELEKTITLKNLQKEESKNTQGQKTNLLQKTKGEEKLYQEYLEESKKKAQEIRKKIFELAQIPESQAPTLEEAYGLALQVEKVTGVRPAFLLALLKIESDIGSNVGQCNCGSNPYCRHPEISWKEVMSEKQWDAFLEVTRGLGLDPNTTPVSCSVNGGKVQWGGAMGPAQFMPNTWLNPKSNYKGRVEGVTGDKPANPWRVRDAFLAAGFYLADWGAASQTSKKEMAAATAYLCGTSLMTSTCRIAGGQSYVYAIMRYASQFQEYIDQGVFN